MISLFSLKKLNALANPVNETLFVVKSYQATQFFLVTFEKQKKVILFQAKLNVIRVIQSQSETSIAEHCRTFLRCIR